MKQNKAEKLLAGVLSISLAMGVSVMPAFAASGETYADMDSVVIKKNYELANEGTFSPAETFSFDIEADNVITFADGYHEHIDALDKAAEQDVRCSIRPEEFIICKDGTDGIHGTVQECTYLGLNTHYTIDTDQGDSVEIVEESSIGEGLKKGEKVLLKVKKEKINVFTKDGGTNLIRSDAYEKQ